VKSRMDKWNSYNMSLGGKCQLDILASESVNLYMSPIEGWPWKSIMLCSLSDGPNRCGRKLPSGDGPPCLLKILEPGLVRI
jgi:hypothetical protein